MTEHPITWNDFEAIEFRAGTIIATEVFPKTEIPADKLTIDFSPKTELKLSSDRSLQSRRIGRSSGPRSHDLST